MSTELEQRVQRVQAEVKRQKLGALLVDDRHSSFYLSGFPCSASLILVTQKACFFYTDSRYITAAEKTIGHMQVVLATQRAFTQVADTVRKHRISRLGFEEQTSHSQVMAMQRDFAGAELIPAGSIIRNLRLIKSDAEIKAIADNQKLNQKIYAAALATVTPGMRESDIRKTILRLMIDQDCEEAFQSIIAAGANSANPHAVPGRDRAKKGELLLFDMGVKRNHYNSDMTRTVAVGERLRPECQRIYDVVLQAQKAAVKELGPGVPCRQVDSVARNIIISAGYGDYFGHGLGHGVGLEIHEGPTLNPRSDETLKPGMVVTVEPGIYLPGVGGVRIEDLLVITETGCQNLTSLTKQLQHICIS